MNIPIHTPQAVVVRDHGVIHRPQGETAALLPSLGLKDSGKIEVGVVADIAADAVPLVMDVRVAGSQHVHVVGFHVEDAHVRDGPDTGVPPQC